MRGKYMSQTKIQKPNWTSAELLRNSDRWNRLRYDTADHEINCPCNLCIEDFQLQSFLACFTEDELVQAAIDEVVRLGKAAAKKNDRMNCRDCGESFPENQMVAFNDDETRSCEDCSKVCEICFEPHYSKPDFIENEGAHAGCALKLDRYRNKQRFSRDGQNTDRYGAIT
jgi:hypothetical protein